jgi:DNA polymerase III subunit alpha
LGTKVTVGGVIYEVKKVFTKKTGAEMAFVRIFDGAGEIDCVVFPKTFEEQKAFLEKEKVVLIKGKIDKREDAFSLVVDDIELFDPETALQIGAFRKVSGGAVPQVEIEIPEKADGELLKKVNLTLRQFPGDMPIFVLIPSGEKVKRLPLTFTVNAGGELVRNIESILGPNSVRLS